MCVCIDAWLCAVLKACRCQARVLTHMKECIGEAATRLRWFNRLRHALSPRDGTAIDRELFHHLVYRYVSLPPHCISDSLTLWHASHPSVFTKVNKNRSSLSIQLTRLVISHSSKSVYSKRKGCICGSFISSHFSNICLKVSWNECSVQILRKTSQSHETVFWQTQLCSLKSH